MVLRLEAEELTQYTDDLDADQKRELLGALLHSLDAVLPFLQKVRSCLSNVTRVCCFVELVSHMRVSLYDWKRAAICLHVMPSTQTLQDHSGEAVAAHGRADSSAAALHSNVVTAAIGECSLCS